MSQKAVGAAVGLHQSTVSRIEHGTYVAVTVAQCVAICEVLGLDAVLKTYPGGPPLRDAAHERLLSDFRRHVSGDFRWVPEMPMPIPGDARAVDVALIGPARIAVEAEVGIEDRQALERELTLKQRDGRFDRMVLLVRASARNRELLKAATFRDRFPLTTHEVLRSLREGRDPGANGIVIL